MKAYLKKRLSKDHEYNRKRHFKRRYKLTVEQVEEMAKAQDYLCAVCSKDRFLVVDHSHSTGKIRGLLCRSCNHDLHVVEEPGLLEKLNSYLERYKK